MTIQAEYMNKYFSYVEIQEVRRLENPEKNSSKASLQSRGF